LKAACPEVKQHTRLVGLTEILRRRPDFAKLWLSRAISSMGDRLTTVALYVLALRSSEGPVLYLAALLMLQHSPGLLFGWFTGVISDRLEKRRLLMFCDIVRGILIITVALNPVKWYYLVVAFFLHSLNYVALPAMQATIPETVEKDELIVANALNSFTSSTIDVAGFAIGVGVVALIGPKAAFGLDFLTYLVSALLVYFVTTDLRPREQGRATWRNVIAGLRLGVDFHFKERTVGLLWVMIFVICLLAFGPLNLLTAVMVPTVLGLDPAMWGTLAAVQGVAMLLTAVAIGKWLGTRFSKRGLMGAGFFLIGLSVLLMGYNCRFGLALVLFFLLGVGNELFLVPNLTWLMEVTPFSLRARIMSIRQMGFCAAIIISTGATALLTQLQAIPLLLKVVGLMSMAVSLLPWFLLDLGGAVATGKEQVFVEQVEP